MSKRKYDDSVEPAEIKRRKSDTPQAYSLKTLKDRFVLFARATKKDLRAIVDLLDEKDINGYSNEFRQSLEWIVDALYNDRRDDNPFDDLRLMVAKPSNFAGEKECPERVLAVFQCTETSYLAKSKDTINALKIDTVFVSPTARRMGICESFLKEVRLYDTKDQLEWFLLTPKHTKEAWSFWRHLGFMYYKSYYHTQPTPKAVARLDAEDPESVDKDGRTLRLALKPFDFNRVNEPDHEQFYMCCKCKKSWFHFQFDKRSLCLPGDYRWCKDCVKKSKGEDEESDVD